MNSTEELEAVVAAVKQSNKYRDTSEETIRELAETALQQHKKPKQAIKAVRKRLHSIMAPYLGDPNYEAAAERLTAVFAANDPSQIKAACAEILITHLSTRERLPILTDFYRQIFAITGPPRHILDIACGLNPLAFPWMGLSNDVAIYAYDIHEPRIKFINHYFDLQGLPQLARLQDVALNFPQEQADVALFLKEMPRFERNYPAKGRALLEALPVQWLVVSFPSVSTHGGRSLVKRYREFYAQLLDGHAWPTTELMFMGEMVFCTRKNEADERTSQQKL